MIIQIYNNDMEKLGLFKVQEDNNQISKDAEDIIINAFATAKTINNDDRELIDIVDEILINETEGQITRVFVTPLVIDA